MQTVRRYGRHSKGERDDFKQRRFLDGMDSNELQRRVVHKQILGDTTVHCVSSFSVSGGFYFVSSVNGIISKCNCQYFTHSQRPCRHIYLLHKVYQNDNDCQLRIMHETLERVLDKHAMVENQYINDESSVSPGLDNLDDMSNEVDSLVAEIEGDNDDEDEVTELLEVLRKGLHDSDCIVKSSESAKKLRKIVEMYYDLPRTISTSGNKKRKLQT